jgi:RNA polymerase sigma-70 factor, ECF subfamily
MAARKLKTALVNVGDPGQPASSMLPPFKVVYRQYFDFVWSTARRLGVEPAGIDDLVQDVFIVIHGKLATVEKPEALRSWIYGVVRRTVSDYRRARRTRSAVGLSVDVETTAPAPGLNPHEQTERRAELELLASLLEQLDEPKREIFSLVELQEVPVPEVAEMLEIPLNTAYSRLRAARRAFEEALARHEARRKGS